MIKFNAEYLQKIAAGHGLKESEWQEYSGKIAEYLDLVKSRGQGFYEIIDDQAGISQLKEFAEKIHGKYKDLVILGIGGSALGAICLQHALGDLFSERIGHWPRMTVLDNVDPVLLHEFEKSVEMNSTLFLVITKSGGTAETMSQYLYFKNRLEQLKLDWREHFVFVTDAKKGVLRKIANENPTLPVFAVPDNVGGRFSVLTTVGLLPAALIGIDIDKLIKGAQLMRESFLSTDWKKNWAFQLAVMQFLLYQKGKNMTVMFPYAQKLLKLADWYRQLLAESIGKAQDRSGKKVNVGITPVVSLGVTDQHSQNQLYNEGPNDKFFIFLEVIQPSSDLVIPDPKELGKDMEYLKGLTFNKLLLTELEGTLQALVAQDRPLVRLSLEELDAQSLGELFLFFEGSIAFLGELFGIDAFDQPGVELSKKITKDLLTK